jgi:CheY-like chemotaxis protein
MKSRAIDALERQVEERTRQLELANLARSRFLAGSHDLRQPLHALGLFVAQLRSCVRGDERKRIIEQVEAALSALNARFNVLLDTAKPDASFLSPNDANKTTTPSALNRASLDLVSGKLIVVIDDDPLVLDGTCGLLRSWGCTVVIADSGSATLASLVDPRRPPDLIISDLHLSHGETGIEAIAAVRSASRNPIPAFLVSGDTGPEAMREARSSDYHLLHKPVDPMALRTMINRTLKKKGSTDACD